MNCHNGKISCSNCQKFSNIHNSNNSAIEISPEWSLSLISGGTSNNKKLDYLFSEIKSENILHHQVINLPQMY